MTSKVNPRAFADEWRYKDASELNFAEKLMKKRNLIPKSSRYVNYPQHKGKVPAYYEHYQYLHVLHFAVAIPLIRWSFTKLTGWNIHPIAMHFLFIAVLYNLFGSVGDHLNKLALKFGYLDGKAPRDTLPRELVPMMFKEMIIGLNLRAGMLVLLAYDRNAPIQLSWWLPVQLAVMSITADFIYYWAHRATHEVGSLWYLHRRHHTTKHPNFLFLSFADEPQEIFDAIAAPAIMYMLYPVSFDTFSIWLVLMLYIESMGHSGLRMYYPAIIASPFLRPFKLELIVEDHDLHHREGWQKSFNYAKQSLLWDTLFGTTRPRIETGHENVEWDLNHYQWLAKHGTSS
ncbi:hypothetical protein MCUN1_002663 [Malassezia cuniculi]|uniref:Fatty acid hydroxylase domain-containing protein n=1 Tax=Malassezia cuniculi TaxID=948313 RepID=A0AAF0F048_9BASI|nr:hypothetical protein MCUN1_002663 [Malassezia cuniculi]